MESMVFALETAASSSNNTDALFSTLYFELHRLAKREIARQWNPITLGVTTLLHETYLDMASRDHLSFPDHSRFIGYAARVMRGLIIDRSRNRKASKRGGDFEITSLEEDVRTPTSEDKELSMIGDAMDRLAEVEPELAEVVDLKFFCGFSFAEIAAMKRLSERTVQRRWEKARIFLHQGVCEDFSF
jgi:RNA polymerase sigma factor (TIGR02999 family)